jgi:hypothetical protein
MKNTRKRQRGAGLRVPIIDDAYQKAFSHMNTTTELDKQLGRLDIYSKLINMKELVSWIYLGKGDLANAALKSRTSTITQIGKRLVTNRYTVPKWFDKNFITKEQMQDYYQNNGFGYHNIIFRYLKQLYILITGSKDGWYSGGEFPVIGTPSESFRSKLANIFGEDVMDRFVENYNDVKHQHMLLRLSKIDNPSGNPLENIADYEEDNLIDNNNEADYAGYNAVGDATYNTVGDAAGNRGGTRRRRRNKSNKRRKNKK